MKSLFTAIDKQDFDTVQKIIAKYPNAVNEPAPAAPKRNAGQSPLRVAIKSRNTNIMQYLIDHGADVNYRDTDSADPLAGTVLHQAVYTAIVHNIRHMASTGRTLEDGSKEYKEFGHKDRFDTGCYNIRLLLDAGADVNALNAQGCNSYVCAVVHALGYQQRAFLRDATHYTGEAFPPDEAKTDACWEEDVKQILDLLISYGASTEVSDKQMLMVPWRVAGAKYIQRMMKQ